MASQNEMAHIAHFHKRFQPADETEQNLVQSLAEHRMASTAHPRF